LSLLDLLEAPETWEQFRAHKAEKGHLTRREAAELDAFVEGRGYAGVAATLGGAIPVRREVNKFGSNKKRVVYSFPAEQNQVLKLLAWLLYRYDWAQPAGCYSFRRDYGAHRAIRELVRRPGIGGMWCYKVDVRDYFNSIDVGRLLPILREVMADDPPLLALLEQLLTSDVTLVGGEPVVGPRGVMAGTPTAPFLANLFLRGLDGWFVGQGVPYARYSDDIVVFAESREEIESHKAELLRILGEHGLEANPAKETLTAPGEPWEFLGIEYDNGQLDLSAATKKKLKGKMRRKARALRRWMLRKGASDERAIRAMIRVFNRKFFSGGNTHDLTWSRWFFPLLTRHDGLQEMDHYLQQQLRWIPTGKTRKSNHRLKYADLKRLGYRSLVHEFRADPPSPPW
jgi:hypothetical protein